MTGAQQSGGAPVDWYRARAVRWTAERDRESGAAIVLARLRLATFGAAALFAWSAWHGWAAHYAQTAVVASVALFVAFLVLVRRHARVLERLERAETGLRLSALGLARLAREWGTMPDVAAPPELDLDAHPYARDLDVFGHASLTKWLGRPATTGGARILWRWLLDPSDPADALARQPAVEELASAREWRETLAIEGQLTTLDTAGLARFLEWAETPRSAVPAFVPVAAVVLPASLAALLALFLAGAVEGAWWLLPLAINVVLSFAFAFRMYASFDRVAAGERSLRRYASMLALVSGREWKTPLLTRLQRAMQAGGPAPRAIARLASLAAWSELRTGAALIHFPVQALTLWDFHILFAMERWRRRSGGHVRAWIEALGEADALSVLAMVRADEPDWAVPHIDAGADALAATAVAHPLIAPGRRVANDVRIGPPGTLLLITGSNMSGKSTLLRAVGLNALLAHAGAPVCASAMTLPPIDLQTSIRVQDSLELGLSYFMAALARLKQIVDAAERGARPGRRLLYLLDEVLQGTNSVERAVAVRAVAQHLIDARAIGAMTTHDLALAEEEPLQSCAALVHFTEQVHPDGTMTFDYRLREGIATSTNALRLMQLIGIKPR